MADAITKRYYGVFSLVFLNFLAFLLFNILGLRFAGSLVLNHEHPQFHQFFTSLFCHINYMHLSGNLFFLYIFGRLIEEEEGLTGILLSFFVCGVGANLVDYIFAPKTGASLGASGAVFGLFTIALLIKFKPKFVNLMECLILIPFVLGYLGNEIAQLGKNDHIGHYAHLYGALCGVTLMIGLRLLKRRLGKPAG